MVRAWFTNRAWLLTLAIGLAAVTLILAVWVPTALARKSADFAGPVFPPPGGYTLTASGADILIGRAGGLDWAFSGFNFGRFESLYWGPADKNGVGIAFDGEPITEPDEVLAFDPNQSDLANGIARWTGSAQLAYWDVGNIEWTAEILDTRFTLTVYDASGPVPLTLGATLGLTETGALVAVTGPFTANLAMEAYYDSSWSPVVDLYDGLGTQNGVQVVTDLADAFFYQDVAIAGLVATNDSPHLITETTTLTATILAGTNVSYTWDLGDGFSATGAIASHSYLTGGNYLAVVTATNNAGFSTATTEVIIQVPSPEPDNYPVYLPLTLRGYPAP